MKKTASTVVMVVAAALALGACSDDGAGTASAPPAATPSGAPTTTLPVIPPPSQPVSGPPVDREDQNICRKVAEAGSAMNKDVRAAAAQNAKDYTPVKKALTAFANKSSAAAGDKQSAVAEAARSMAKAATEGATAKDPMTTMNTGSYVAYFTSFKESCAAAGVPFQQ